MTHNKGITPSQMAEHILHEFLPGESLIRSVIIHVGTNSASTSRANLTISQVVKDIEQVIQLLSSMYPQADIWFSAILPRLDNDNNRVLAINKVNNTN